MQVKSKNIVPLVLVLLILLLAALLRIGVVAGTDVISPIRADATEYYFYALNLKECGVYSQARQDFTNGCPSVPESDAQRPPGYPLALLPFVEYPPTPRMVYRIQIFQVLLGVLTVVLSFLLFRGLLGTVGAVLTAVLVALSPHLVASVIYVLTETLFTALLVAWALISAKFFERPSLSLAFAAGAMLAFTALVRPTMTYFIVLFLPFVYLVLERRKLALAAMVMLGFCIVFAPWTLRNEVFLADKPGSTVARNVIHIGMYPDLMYQDDERTLGFPNRFDPHWGERNDIASVFSEIKRRFVAEPLRYTHWYLIGKPITFLSWDIIVGMGDVFIYPVRVNAYNFDPLLGNSHALMKWWHWPLVTAAMLAAILLWIPKLVKCLPVSAVLSARLLTLVLLYFFAVHIVGTSLPRYSIPLRPVMYGLAVLLPVIILGILGKRRKESPSIAPDREP